MNRSQRRKQGIKFNHVVKSISLCGLTEEQYLFNLVKPIKQSHTDYYNKINEENDRQQKESTITATLKNGFTVEAHPLFTNNNLIVDISGGQFMYTLSYKRLHLGREAKIVMYAGVTVLGFKDIYSALRSGCINGLKLRKEDYNRYQ